MEQKDEKDKDFSTLFAAFQLELILANRSFCKRGIRNVVQKRVDRSPRKPFQYSTYDGEKWNPKMIRMNARQLREQKKGVLSGCVEGCQKTF